MPPNPTLQQAATASARIGEPTAALTLAEREAIAAYPLCLRAGCSHSALSHRHEDGRRHVGGCARCGCQRLLLNAQAVVNAAARCSEAAESEPSVEPSVEQASPQERAPEASPAAGGKCAACPEAAEPGAALCAYHAADEKKHLAVPCDVCGAAVEQRCRNDDGTEMGAGGFHGGRRLAVMQASGDGASPLAKRPRSRKGTVKKTELSADAAVLEPREPEAVTTTNPLAPRPFVYAWEKLKPSWPDVIIFSLVGDRYELFGDDALQAGVILGLSPVMVAGGLHGAKIPALAFPKESIDRICSRIIAAGPRVAVAENLGKGEAATEEARAA